MASIRITQFAGIVPEVNARLKPATNAQIAHNCLLTDGSLRPQAEWVRVSKNSSSDILGISYDAVMGMPHMYRVFDPVTLTGEPFADRVTVGVYPYEGGVEYYTTGEGFDWSERKVGISAAPMYATVTYQRGYDSVKPVNRMYAITRVRKYGNRAEEGALIPLPGQSPTDIVYEGDLVNIEIDTGVVDDGTTHLRIYRSISGLDTGQNITNELDTNWHLVDELPYMQFSVLNYTDGDAATILPLDVCYSMEFHGPTLYPSFFGLSDSGWFVSASQDGMLNISERYMHHAYPVSNYLRIPEKITDMVVHMDNVYIGTEGRPYIIALSAGEKGLQAAATPYGEVLACLPGSMTRTASGAMYASPQGLVALGREGQQVISRNVVNAGDVMYRKTIEPDDYYSGEPLHIKASIGNTAHGRYFAGSYYGFCEGIEVSVKGGA